MSVRELSEEVIKPLRKEQGQLKRVGISGKLMLPCLFLAMVEG